MKLENLHRQSDNSLCASFAYTLLLFTAFFKIQVGQVLSDKRIELSRTANRYFSEKQFVTASTNLCWSISEIHEWLFRFAECFLNCCKMADDFIVPFLSASLYVSKRGAY